MPTITLRCYYTYCTLFVSLLLFCGCGQLQSGPDIAPTPTASLMPAALATDPSSSVLPEQAPSQSKSLVIWLPPFLDLSADTSAGTILTNVLAQFEQTNPGVRIEVQIKAETGDASIQSYLRSAQQVAPTVLPDVIVLDSNQLWRLVDIGLVSPLSTTDIAELADFYPFTLDSVTYQERIYGIPYVADVVHMAYFPPTGVPAALTWPDILASGSPYLFPAGGRDGNTNEAFLIQYVGAGGQLTEAAATYDEEPLTAVFQLLATGRERGVFPPALLEYSTLNALWADFLTKGSGFAHVSASAYLNQENNSSTAYSPIPTLSGAPVTVGHSWAFVILAADPEFRTLALNLIWRLTDPSIQGPWSHSMRLLPARRSALELWGTTLPYYDFLRQQMEVALSIPGGSTFASFSAHLQSVQNKILSGELSIEDALAEMAAQQ